MSNTPTVPALSRTASFLQPPAVVPPAADGTDPSAVDVASLTPDALMAYCQSRLESIDGQVKQDIASQQRRIGQAADLQKVLATLQQHAGGTTNPQDCQDMEQALRDEIESLVKQDPGFPGLAKLKQTYNDLVFTGTGETGPIKYYHDVPIKTGDKSGDNKINDSEMQDFIAAVNGTITNLNSGSELGMIQIESLMSQRQTAVQLTTNLVQSLGDQANKIAQNIGH